MRSYFFSMALKRGKAIFEMTAMVMPRNGIAASMMTDSSPLMRTAISVARTSIIGERAMSRIIIWKDCWTLVMSLVRRVTREAVENLSIFLAENDSTC